MSMNMAEKITPKDDAFHSSSQRIAAEWWYFDAALNDEISVHIGFKTFTKRNRGFVSPLIEVYNKGRLEYASRKRFPLRSTVISTEIPSIHLHDKPIIIFDKETYDDTGEWCYHVNFGIDDLYVDLKFIGITEGWKIETPLESWAVALPKAKVLGSIRIKEKTIEAHGFGYHDHNWNYSMLTLLNYGKGWYWGKIRSETFTITWADIIKSSKKEEVLAVLNQDEKRFLNIDPSTISFSPQNIISSHRKKVPTKFVFQFHDTPPQGLSEFSFKGDKPTAFSHSDMVRLSSASGFSPAATASLANKT